MHVVRPLESAASLTVRAARRRRRRKARRLGQDRVAAARPARIHNSHGVAVQVSMRRLGFFRAQLLRLPLSCSHELAQRAWNLRQTTPTTCSEDSSDACVRYDAPTLACACIHLAAADLSVLLPCDPNPGGLFLMFRMSGLRASL